MGYNGLMRYLGIDFGSKRVGVAVSDESNSFAFPVSVVQNSPDLLEELALVCRKYTITDIVIGESKNFSQEDNLIMKEVAIFMGQVAQHIGIPTHLHPEFLTSLEAKQIQGKNDMLDASAAALILKSYLDTHNPSHQ